MAEQTNIEWTRHTFNPWIGCTAVSAGCDHCYAETLVKRWGGDFATRRRTSLANWKQPLKWNRQADAEGMRRRVFCASLADVFDNNVPVEWRNDLWALIRATPWLDWQLLTKRPQNIAKMLPPDWGHGFHNVWLGTTVENQTEADRRIPHLLAVPAAVHFLSCEPLISAVDLRPWLTSIASDGARAWGGNIGLHWVIIGGESGPGARPMHAGWARSLRDQCAAAGVPFHFKQWGEWLPGAQYTAAHSARDPGDYSRFVCMDWEDGVAEEANPMNDLTGDEVYRVGKKAAGNRLDGRQHREFPA